MTYDQRFASQRPDVLVYQTDPLDRDVTITGPGNFGPARIHHRHGFRFHRQTH